MAAPHRSGHGRPRRQRILDQLRELTGLASGRTPGPRVWTVPRRRLRRRDEVSRMTQMAGSKVRTTMRFLRPRRRRFSRSNERLTRPRLRWQTAADHERRGAVARRKAAQRAWAVPSESSRHKRPVTNDDYRSNSFVLARPSDDVPLSPREPERRSRTPMSQPVAATRAATFQLEHARCRCPGDVRALADFRG